MVASKKKSRVRKTPGPRPPAEIREVDIGWLRPAAYNPRVELKPGDPEFESLVLSLREFGHVYPIVANRDGTVVGGHQTLAALKHLGRTRVRVSVVDLPPERERALNLALNRIRGTWDDAKLKDLLQELDTSGMDMALTGFSAEEVDDMLKRVTGLDGQDDELPPAPRTPITRPGDTWICGRHRVHCGDSRQAAAVRAATAGEAADLCVTSPPYNVGIAYRSFKDSRPRDEYLALISAVARQVYAALKPGRFVAWNVGVSPDTFPHRQVCALEDAGFAFYRQIVWEKAGVPYPIFGATLRARRARKYTPNYKHEVVDVMEKPGGEVEPACACPLCDGTGQAEPRGVQCAELADKLVLAVRCGGGEAKGMQCRSSAVPSTRSSAMRTTYGRSRRAQPRATSRPWGARARGWSTVVSALTW